MLEVSNIHTFYRESHILHGVSLKVGEGAVVALLGRNGMGKTTTVRSIIGFTPPRSGKIIYNGHEIQTLNSYQIAQLGVGMVPQGRRIFPSLSVQENLAIACRGQGWTIDKVCELFPMLKIRAKNRGNQLSGGEQQMLAIARAMMTNPTLMLMDEPSEGLAPLMVREVAGIVSRLKDNGISVLLVEQNLPLALEVSNYVYIMHKGEIVYESTPAQLATDEKIQAEYLAVAQKT
jgi:branched-chain amino acid transport system ATP-binding protein